MKTTDLFDYYQTDGKKRLRIRLADPLQLPDEDLLVDPYILGYWLGDGTSIDGTITVGDQDYDEVLALLSSGPYDIRVTKYAGHRASTARLVYSDGPRMGCKARGLASDLRRARG